MIDPAKSGLLTTQEAARAMRIAAITLHRWRGQGQGPNYVPLGRKVFYRQSDIDAWLDAMARQPDPGAT